VIRLKDLTAAVKKHSHILNFLLLDSADAGTSWIREAHQIPNLVIILSSHNQAAMPDMRNVFLHLNREGGKFPVILMREYSGLEEDLVKLYAATDAGTLLSDGFGNGLMLKAPNVSLRRLNEINFGILQAARVRISKTEFISCPSCGRTLFDLQETTNLIRNRTGHLKGLKIAIMGCIVNGPGEMADADYGYVGSGPGKITLYRGREIIKRNVPSSQALDELVSLIDEDGNWREPVS
jgi:(E)-4-hydroxy-3-methylbut-2-enyl-diphosphate synthase